MKVLLWGQTTYIGALAKSLATRLDCIICPEHLDFRDKNQVYKFIKISGCRIIVNCGALTGGIGFVRQFPADIYSANLYSFLNLYDSSKKLGIAKIVNLISNSSYAPTRKKLKEDKWHAGSLDEDVLAIGFAAKALWACSKVFWQQYRVNSVNLIVSNVYGPGEIFDAQKSYALGAIIAKIRKAIIDKNRRVILWGSGKAVRDWLYVDDLARVIVAAISIKSSGELINIGSGEGVSIGNLAAKIKKIMNYRGQIEFDQSNTNGVLYKVMDISKSAKQLRWKPKTTLTEGLKKTIDWYLANVGKI